MNVIWKRSIFSYNVLRLLTREIKSKPLHCYYHNRTLIGSKSPILIKPLNSVYNTSRLKSKKQSDPDSDDEVEIKDDDASLTKDSRVVKFSTTSLRTDAILKSALGIARNKVEKIFYESKIRVNGKKILKKSVPVREEYEIDVIKSVSPKNPDHLYISRVEIINITAKEESITVTARRFKTLLIENYEIDPYKQSSAAEE